MLLLPLRGAGGRPGRDAHCADNTVDVVREFGWSSAGVASSDGVPAWAYSIGLWHTLGSGEVAMFGLNLPDMPDVRIVHLHHLYAKHPAIASAARLTPGRQMWLDEHGRWHESALE